jgi:ribonuclease PH
VEVQATAEGLPFANEDMTRLIELARPAIQQLVAMQKSITQVDLPAARA